MNTNSASDDGKWKCVPQRDDYNECLHHRKEVSEPIPLVEYTGDPKEKDLIIYHFSATTIKRRIMLINRLDCENKDYASSVYPPREDRPRFRQTARR